MKQIYLDVNKDLYNEIFDLESDASTDETLLELLGSDKNNKKDKKKDKKSSKKKKEEKKKHVIYIVRRKK